MSDSVGISLGPVVLVNIIALILLVVFTPVVMQHTSTHIQDVTRSWKTQPIVSVYVPPNYEWGVCADGFEVLELDANALSGVSQGPCGCAQNSLPYQSSNETCSMAAELTDVCSSLRSLPEVLSSGWRVASVCVKRVDAPAAYYRDGYHGRPHPNKYGNCPNGYKKCGEGLTFAEGAVCFPEDSECPVTNMQIVPTSQPLPVSEGWEPVGTFTKDNVALYVRREYPGELPVINITVALTEVTTSGDELRGPCYSGAAQTVQTSLRSNPRALWSYNASPLPPVCKVTDPRWKLIDTVRLEDYFLESAETTVSTCDAYKLYSLSDPRYNASADPDYLHSGVPCGTAPLYSACARDPFQHTDCAAGDSICDGVVHQNICGEYAMAVRSGLGTMGASMGLYFVREIEWSDTCAVSKASIFRYRTWIADVWLFTFLGGVFVLFAPLSFVLYVPGFVFICKLFVVYKAVSSGHCTDDFTTTLLTSRLEPVDKAFVLALAVILLLLPIIVIWGLAIREPSPSTVTPMSPAEERREAVATNQSAVALRLSMMH